MRNPLTFILFIFLGCTANEDTQQRLPTPDPTCEGFFGLPNMRSGLSESVCSTRCLCSEGETTWQTPVLTSDRMNAVLDNPPTPIEEDPYAMGVSPVTEQNLACVIRFDENFGYYELLTVPVTDADSDFVTHTGPCGACSSLQDLKVYAQNVDLTQPVRSCGIMGISAGQAANVECLKDIGFSDACATIWYFNTKHTREKCLSACLQNLDTPYVTEDGELNPCLSCDETESGPIFKKISGRTRRNSGLPSAICRPCASVSRIHHQYLD